MPKILWMSPYSLIDKSSGASVNCLQIFQYLQQCGFETWACSAFCCDNQSGSKELFELLDFDPKTSNQSVFRTKAYGINFVYTRTASTTEFDMTLEECQLYYAVYTKLLDEIKPDFVAGYGLAPLPILCRYEAQKRGIAVIQYVFNGEQRGFRFPFTDQTITDSFATSNFYAQKELINIQATGAVFDVSKSLSPIHQPQFVTMINPSPTKGVAIFAKLLSVCEQQMPEVKFLTIETRSKIYQELEHLHSKDNPQEFPLKGHKFKNLQVLPIQSNIKNVYALTKVLLVPSLWFESWGRVSTEAGFNHIPVISSNSGGIPEAFNGAGISIAAPEHCIKDHYSLPTDEEIQPWVDALKTILQNDWSEAFDKVYKSHNQSTTTLRTLNALQTLRPHIFEVSNIHVPYDFESLSSKLAPCSLRLDTQATNAINVFEQAPDLLNPQSSQGSLTLSPAAPAKDELTIEPISLQSVREEHSQTAAAIAQPFTYIDGPANYFEDVEFIKHNYQYFYSKLLECIDRGELKDPLTEGITVKEQPQSPASSLDETNTPAESTPEIQAGLQNTDVQRADVLGTALQENEAQISNKLLASTMLGSYQGKVYAEQIQNLTVVATPKDKLDPVNGAAPCAKYYDAQHLQDWAKQCDQMDFETLLSNFHQAH